MSFVAPEKPVWESPTPPRKGSGLKWVLLGCGGLMLVGVVLCGGLAVWGIRWGMKQVDQMTEEFVAKGYEKKMAQIVELNQSPDKKTVYACQVLKVRADVDVDIAAVCQVMEVEADIHGDLDFLGQVLKVKAGCVIDGDLRIKNAQVVEIQGEVTGKITGDYWVLTYQGKSYPPGQSPTTEDGADALTPEAPAPTAPATPATPEAPPLPAPPVAPEAPATPAEVLR